MEQTSGIAGQAQTTVYTIGYGSRTIEQFIEALKTYEIAYLIDIRSAPYSRFKPEFSKGELETRLRQDGVRYVYMGDLLGGLPADRECYVDDKVVYEILRQKAFFREGIDRIRRAFEQQLRVVLMCSEGKPETCHRSKLIGEVLADLGIPVLHIDEHGELRRQAEVILNLTAGQLGLFEENTFTSRKRYHAREDEDAT